MHGLMVIPDYSHCVMFSGKPLKSHRTGSLSNQETVSLGQVGRHAALVRSHMSG